MHLASDYIQPYEDAGGRPSYCRARIYLPYDVRDAPVVICSEVPNNPGGSITNTAEAIAAGVIRENELPTPLVWIEHWPEESTDAGEETVDLVVFLATRLPRGRPTWGDEGKDKGRYIEGTRPYKRGGVGRREGVGEWLPRVEAAAMVP
jgi:hypothetical protein